MQYEILCDGSLPDDWTWRLSTADITQDVPFSIFPGVNREFCVADGNGVVLTINGVEHRCDPGSITKFRGDDDVYARLIDGPMRALNLMVRDEVAPIHLCRKDMEGSLAIVAIGKMQVIESDGKQFYLDVLDAVVIKNQRLPINSVCDQLIFVV